MERNYKTILYTEEDEKRICFRILPGKEKEKAASFVRKKRKKYFIIFVILLVPSLIIQTFCKNGTVQYILTLYDICILFLLGLNMYSCHLKMKNIKKREMLYCEIELLKKLPVETQTEYNYQGPNQQHYYYPVIGKDVVTGYETKYYIEEEQYKKSNVHEKIKVIRYI